MKKSIGSISLAFVLLTVLLSGCAAAPTPVQPTFTPSPIPPTFTPEPTATRTSVPLSPTPTELPIPTPSGKFEFLNVALDQAGKDTVHVSFGYQLKQGLDLNGLLIMAQASSKGASCNSGRFTLFSKPYAVNEAVSGIVKGADAASISMTEPGKCSFKGFTLMVFHVQGSTPVTLYKQDFEIPFELEK